MLGASGPPFSVPSLMTCLPSTSEGAGFAGGTRGPRVSESRSLSSGTNKEKCDIMSDPAQCYPEEERALGGAGGHRRGTLAAKTGGRGRPPKVTIWELRFPDVKSWEGTVQGQGQRADPEPGAGGGWWPQRLTPRVRRSGTPRLDAVPKSVAALESVHEKRIEAPSPRLSLRSGVCHRDLLMSQRPRISHKLVHGLSRPSQWPESNPQRQMLGSVVVGGWAGAGVSRVWGFFLG